MALVTNKFVFVHVPKTGGSWCRDMINSHFIEARETGPFQLHDHLTMRQLREGYREFDKLLIIGFVRHPITWYASRWSWAKLTQFGLKIQNSNHPASNHWMAEVWSEDYHTFIENVLRKGCPYASYTFLDALFYESKWAAIGLYEDLYRDFLRMTGLPPNTISLPVSKPGAKVLKPIMTRVQRIDLSQMERDAVSRWYPSIDPEVI